MWPEQPNSDANSTWTRHPRIRFGWRPGTSGTPLWGRRRWRWTPRVCGKDSSPDPARLCMYDVRFWCCDRNKNKYNPVIPLRNISHSTIISYIHVYIQCIEHRLWQLNNPPHCVGRRCRWNWRVVHGSQVLVMPRTRSCAHRCTKQAREQATWC